jgi:Flp pilus assembly protein TadD
LRAANVLVSYLTYIGKTYWPTALACWYPYPSQIPLWEPLLCGAGLVTATICVIWLLRIGRAPWLATGWFWYLVTLLPVIGIVQVGSQSRADRYMYIPMTGLLIMTAWGAGNLVGRWPRYKWPAVAIGSTVCIALLPLTWIQIQTWRSTETLFSHDLIATKDSYIAYGNLGMVRMEQGRLTEALLYLKEALRINPQYPEANSNIGAVLSKLDRWGDALPYFITAVGKSPPMPGAYRNLGEALIKVGKPSAAVDPLEMAVLSEPSDADAQNMLGFALAHRPGRRADAIDHIRQALALKPKLQTAHANLGALLAASPDDRDEAVAELRTALAMNPEDHASAESLRLLEGGVKH